MGGGPHKENLLIVMRDPENKTLTDKIRNQFPYIELKYYQLESEKVTDESGKKTSRDKPVPIELFKWATILVALGYLPSKPEDAPNLKLIQLFSAGIDHYVSHPIFTDTDIPITTVSGIHGAPIAEYVLLTSLVASRAYKAMYEQQREHAWTPSIFFRQGTTDWVDKTVGIAGYGSIGRQVANVFVSMGAKVHAFTASPRTTAEARKDAGYVIPGIGDPDGIKPSAWYSGKSKADLHTFLRSGLDMLVISLPLTNATRGLFGKEEFEVMAQGLRDKNKGVSRGLGIIPMDNAAESQKADSVSENKLPAPFLTNISRGQILKQSELVDALNSEVLGGAALDVTDPEPLLKDDPLWDAKNVIITPHISALGLEYMTRAFDVFILNLKRLERGEELVNEVQRKRQY